MKMFFKYSLFIAFCFLSFLLQGQFNPQDLQSLNGNANAAISAFLGPNVQFSNASFVGSNQQLGTFNNGLNKVGINQGIIIATSNLTFPTLTLANLDGSSNPNSFPNGGLNNVSDPFISGNINDFASLSFEFVSTSNLLQFEFVFASAEYPFFVGSQFNDKFVFVLTEFNEFGGIVNESNIALLPGTNTVISINSVNNGSSNPTFSNLPAQNPEYFVSSSNNWVYQGRTTVIPISKEIKCNTRYKLRISICDIQDRLLDCAVFLKNASWNNENQVGEIQVPPGPFCEGEVITASVSGPANSLYEWSDGQSGIGLNSIQFTTNTTTPSISVTVTSPNIENCTFFRTKNIVVHSSNNLPPYINGINNSGQYIAYVRAGEELNFQIPAFDTPTEEVIFLYLNTFQGPEFEINQNTSQEVGLFKWTPTDADIGSHTFEVNALDRNACISLPSDIKTFTIIVICRYCEISIDYANRFPSSNPIPELTEMAYSITAGINGPVVIDKPTIFRAGEYIIADVQFDSGGELIEEIVPVCNETICENCCENISGLSLPVFIPDVFSPNGDGINDFWYVPDFAHPFCAFNAQSFELYIYDRWGIEVYSLTQQTNQCCPFQSPENPAQGGHSSIFWDGIYNDGSIALNAVYSYVLKIKGCQETFNQSGTISLLGVNSGARMAQEPIKPDVYDQEPRTLPSEIIGYPNPTNSIFNLSLANFNLPIRYKINYNVYDEVGKSILDGTFNENYLIIDLTNFSSGVYFCRIYSEMFEKNLIILKQ